MNIFLKTEDEIDLMRAANRLVGATLAEVGRNIQPGFTTLRLDQIAEEFIRDHGATPVFKNFPNPFGPPFPASICASVNHEVVHGVPSRQTVLREGDIISIDCGVQLDGYCGDSCYTFRVGEVKPETRALLQTTKEALYLGIRQAVQGNHLGDIGHAIASLCEARGYTIVKELTGHGIGRQMHEDPPVPNEGKPGDGPMLTDGMCIAIEPMVAMGERRIGLMPDKWTIVTLDGKPAAHFEHTIAIHQGRTEILSTFTEIEQIEESNPLWQNNPL